LGSEQASPGTFWTEGGCGVTQAHITSIVYQPSVGTSEQQDGGFLRVPISEALLLAGHGIKGDAKAGRHPKRQLNLLSEEWLSARRTEGFRAEPGDFGEQLVIAGLAVESCQRGERLQLGPEVVIEITAPRTGCKRLKRALAGQGEFSSKSVGMLAAVVQGGAVRVGDAVTSLG